MLSATVDESVTFSAWVMAWFGWLSVAATFVTALLARLRSKPYAIFTAASLLLHSGLAAGMLPPLSFAWPVFLYLHLCVYIQHLARIRPRLRSLPYRLFVSIPAAFFAAGTFLSLPWVLVGVLDIALPAPWLPYVVAAVGVAQSLGARRSEPELALRELTANRRGDGLRRLAARASASRDSKPLRLVQITDPHLGPFMSIARLRRVCQRAVARNPDLIVLTGDFLTMESQSDPTLLARALEPLTAARGKTFACLGNHDYEALDHVRRALHEVGVELLVDAAALVETSVGTVQVVGLDYAFRQRYERIRAALARHPRIPGVPRLVLLHDPGGFVSIPDGDADLVLSGHTHGGQVGLLSLGLPYTLLRLFAKVPDHGAWAKGQNVLYVHRGTGHYGFPLRVGVPAEESVLTVLF